ncbi:MAG: hypothetical protein OCD02_05780 [Spirochaetaceae bacterium]
MNEKIGQSLIRLDLLSFDQAEEVLRVQQEEPHRIFGDIAMSLGYISSDDLDGFIDNSK